MASPLIRNTRLALWLTLGLLGILALGLVARLPTQGLLALSGLFVVVSGWYALGRKSLTVWILIAMVWGVLVGYLLPGFAQNLDVFSGIFLKLIKTAIGPLLFATLVVGIAGHTNLRQVGRMGVKSLVYFELVTTAALFIGLASINLTEAGVGVAVPTGTAAAEGVQAPAPQGWKEIVLHTFPDNIAKSVAEGQVLQIVVFSVLFAIGLAMVAHEDKRRPMLRFADSLAEAMFKFVKLIMYLAPFAVGAAMAVTVGKMGLEVLEALFYLLATLYGALVAFVLGVLLPIALAFRIPVRKFVKAVQEPASIAFATTSSEAALPSALERMENLGVPRYVVAFVLPTGYSFNLDGTTLYLSLAAVFVAQVAGVDLTLGEQILMCITLMLTSKGVAGVPRASFIILLGTVAMFNIPPEKAVVIMGVDALMDMARTTVNVVGNCLASCVIARWEGAFDDQKAEEY